MLITPRLYGVSQSADSAFRHKGYFGFGHGTSWNHSLNDYRLAANMLLLHQTGSVRVGEVVRYTVTYTPSADRILPAPQHLHVKIKNTSAVPLRAAYLHGPYTLYVACYPSTFDPNKKHENHQQEGAPDFEPNLKAGGHWSSRLSVPQNLRDAAGSTDSPQSVDGSARKFTWIIEIVSQVIFSTTAAVHFEVLMGRDERSVELGMYPNAAAGQDAPGRLEDHRQGRTNNSAQARGVYSKAVRLAVDDTTSLWNSPAFPAWKGDEHIRNHRRTKETVLDDTEDKQQQQKRPSRKKQRVHLVIVTHGIHSNVGADMLFLKESIDAAAKQGREDAKKKRAQMTAERVKGDMGSEGQAKPMWTPDAAATSPNLAQEDPGEEDDEQVIVRGFGENVVRTERGIQYMGKRLAKYVLAMTYPDQPYLPVKSSISKTIAKSLTGQRPSDGESQLAHRNSSIRKNEKCDNDELAYQISSISFVGHSLGGLTQTYAIAYIKKHSPEFFDRIRPINFVAMATPFLGLSNENPIYVKFALDFGLVGRTGQDLGLTWRAPTMVRSGWDAMIGGLGSENQKNKTETSAGAKPLLRILPTGPAHAALKLFRNRSVYSNVVNDGIVPLRTSCLLFLDWRGLGRVEKARRENGIVGTMVGWGWAEMTGQNASSRRSARPWSDSFNDSGEESDAKKGRRTDRRHDVPQPSENDLNEDKISANDVPIEPKPHQFLGKEHLGDEVDDEQKTKQVSAQQPSTAWSGFLSLFRPQASSKPPQHPPKSSRIYHRGQTKGLSQDTDSDSADTSEMPGTPRKSTARGSSFHSNTSGSEELETPPRTTFFESAGHLLKPPLPSTEFLLDPASRPQTIFHDRIYHPQDIPAPATKQNRSTARWSLPGERGSKPSFNGASNPTMDTTGLNNSASDPGTADMKIEEKIARAYHRELSWRKVLVRLEPDAHNNIIVRRMFANAYGWPVVKHMCDTHFGYTASAMTDDAMEANVDRAQTMGQHISGTGEQVQGQQDSPVVGQKEFRARGYSMGRRTSDAYRTPDGKTTRDLERLRGSAKRTNSEIMEASDEVQDLGVTTANVENSISGSGTKANLPYGLPRQDSARWSDRFFEGSDDDSDVDYMASPIAPRSGWEDTDAPRGTNDTEIADFLGQTRSPKGSPKPLITQGFTSPPRPLRSRGWDAESTQPTENAIRPDRTTAGLTGVGLGPSVEEYVLSTDRGSKSIPVQVAMATAEQEREQAKD